MAPPPTTLAQRVRATYPGVYDDLSDQDLEAKVLAKFPGVYDDLPRSAATPPAPTATPTWADRLGLNTPTPPGTPVRAGLKGAAAGAVDLAQGVTGAAARTLFAGEDAKDAMNRQLGIQAAAPNPQQREALTQIPTTFSGQIGRGLETGADLYAAGQTPVTEAVEAIPRTARAARTFQTVMAAAKEVPVDLGGPGGVGDVALRIKDLADRGGVLPKAVNDLLEYGTDPTNPPMTYAVARDFASNISRLSRDELGALTPVMQREVANLRVVLHRAVGQAASVAGKSQEYVAAMNEYARAMRARQFIETGLRRVGIPFTVGATGAWLADKALKGAAGLFGGD